MKAAGKWALVQVSCQFVPVFVFGGGERTFLETKIKHFVKEDKEAVNLHLQYRVVSQRQ